MMLGGVAGLTLPAMTGCAGRQTASRPSDNTQSAPPASAGLDAVIDISHNVTVTDFTLVRRRSNILGVIHKATEGGDWVGMGRLYCYGLAAAGAAGIERVIELLEEEMKEVMGLLGVTSLKQLDKSYIAPAMPTNLPGVHSAFPLLNLEDHGY